MIIYRVEQKNLSKIAKKLLCSTKYSPMPQAAEGELRRGAPAARLSGGRGSLVRPDRRRLQRLPRRGRGALL